MLKTISRASEKKSKVVKKRTRSNLVPETNALNLAIWLNNCGDSKARDRVVSVLGLVRQVSEILQNPFIKKNPVSWSHHTGVPVVQQFNGLYDDLRRRLARYVFTPFVLPPVFEGTSAWHQSWVPARGTKQAKYEEKVVSSLAGQPVHVLMCSSETDGIKRLLEAMSSNSLDRVIVCDHCERWCVRKFAHQVQCGEKCRIAKFRASPAYREHRNQKARDYYKIHREKNTK